MKQFTKLQILSDSGTQANKFILQGCIYAHNPIVGGNEFIKNSMPTKVPTIQHKHKFTVKMLLE
jgi:hypothetical protein